MVVVRGEIDVPLRGTTEMGVYFGIIAGLLVEGYVLLIVVEKDVLVVGMVVLGMMGVVLALLIGIGNLLIVELNVELVEVLERDVGGYEDIDAGMG